MSYNFDEHLSDNHYNCPVVAYYPDLLGVNIPALEDIKYLHPNLGLHRPKDFEKKGAQLLETEFGIPKRASVKAIRKAYAAYEDFRRLVQKAEQKPEGRRFVYINAWNEWAEGTYLEPDEKNGYGYLEAVQRVMRERTQD